MSKFNLFLKNNLNKIIIILLIINIAGSLFSLLMASRCEGSFSQSCLLEKNKLLNSDFNWNYNTIKYIVDNGGSFPKESTTGVRMLAMWQMMFFSIFLYSLLFTRT